MPDDPKDLPPDEAEPRGCFAVWGTMGLAVYAFIVLGMLATGLLGIMGATVMMMLQHMGSGGALMSGVDTEVWRLKELRGVGILTSDLTPSAYHDHSDKLDGSAGCLIVGDELVSWEGWAERARVTLDGAALSVEGPEDAPTVILTGGGAAVRCPFEPDQGGDRFVRMLRAELRDSETQ